MRKNISITDVVYGRLKDLKLCDGDSFNAVIERLLNIPQKERSTYYAVIECKITGEVCYSDAHCESCSLAKDEDKRINKLNEKAGDE